MLKKSRGTKRKPGEKYRVALPEIHGKKDRNSSQVLTKKLYDAIM
jgi:hypothetical protein